MLPKLEQIAPASQASVTAKRFHSAGFDYEWHFHPEVELTLILAGRGQRFVGDSIEAFAPDEVVLLGPNLPHTWHSRAPDSDADPPDETNGSAEAVVVQFAQDFAGPGLWGLPEAEAVAALLRRAERGLVLEPNAHGLTERLCGLVDLKGWALVLGVLEVLGEMAADPDAGRVLSDPAHAVAPRRDDQRRIDRVCRWAAEHYTQPLRQTEAAATAHLSPSSFSRFFKRMTGRTFVAYLHELRIAEACRQLTDPQRPITDICFACGFENLSNFNRTFRRLRGVSPRNYRKQIAAPPE
ncbi:MAG: AraC family transcriptional regulator [Planctomycetota bacterium]